MTSFIPCVTVTGYWCGKISCLLVVFIRQKVYCWRISDKRLLTMSRDCGIIHVWLYGVAIMKIRLRGLVGDGKNSMNVRTKLMLKLFGISIVSNTSKFYLKWYRNMVWEWPIHPHLHFLHQTRGNQTERETVIFGEYGMLLIQYLLIVMSVLVFLASMVSSHFQNWLV